MSVDFKFLQDKAKFVKRESLRLHKLAPGTRIASSLSPIEIFVVLYYGRLLSVDPGNIYSEDRDRFIISKGHGSISLYPILADFGFLGREELDKICHEGTRLGSIPDPSVPGYETINGSLGHGLAVATGVAIALREKMSERRVFVLSGDGELYEGSVWESIMFAPRHKLDNLILIIDSNKACMLDYCKNIIDLEPLKEKFNVFGWDACCVDGHNIEELYRSIQNFKNKKSKRPKVIIADTVKGKGVPSLEGDSLSHIRILKEEDIERLLSESE